MTPLIWVVLLAVTCGFVAGVMVRDRSEARAKRFLLADLRGWARRAIIAEQKLDLAVTAATAPLPRPRTAFDRAADQAIEIGQQR